MKTSKQMNLSERMIRMLTLLDKWSSTFFKNCFKALYSSFVTNTLQEMGPFSFQLRWIFSLVYIYMSEYSHPLFRIVKAMLGALSAQISSVPESKKWGGRMPAPPRYSVLEIFWPIFRSTCIYIR